jgi:hypothetical protein
MHPRRLRLFVVGLLTASAGSLAACGAGAASHVVQGTNGSRPTTSSPTAPTSAPPATSGSGVSPTTGASSPPLVINAQTLDQISAELSALDSTINQANNDLSNPQSDS